MWLMLGVTSGMGIARTTGYYPIDYKDWAPFLVSIAVLVYTGIQAHSSKKQTKHNILHSKLSVKPKVQFELIRNLDEPITIGIINNGLGPAILGEIIITIEGKKYIYSKAETQTILKGLCKSEGLEYTPVILLKNLSLPTNKKYNLMTFTNTKDNEIFFQNANELIGTKLNFEFKYKSMYGDKFRTNLFKTDRNTEIID